MLTLLNPSVCTLKPCYKGLERCVPRDGFILYKESSPSFSLLYKGEVALRHGPLSGC